LPRPEMLFMPPITISVPTRKDDENYRLLNASKPSRISWSCVSAWFDVGAGSDAIKYRKVLRLGSTPHCANQACLGRRQGNGCRRMQCWRKHCRKIDRDGNRHDDGSAGGIGHSRSVFGTDSRSARLHTAPRMGGPL
jgi:hypothetical protein